MDSQEIRREVYAGAGLEEQKKMRNATGDSNPNPEQDRNEDAAQNISGQTIENMLRSEANREKIFTEEEKKEAYNAYVKENAPKKSLPLQMLKAFLCGGIICTIGQVILNTAKGMGLSVDEAGSWCCLLLVLLSVVLTGLSIYQIIADWGGAGALVPITGFANSVASTAIEYKTEGQVYGIGVKIFTIAGPVILYGIFTSWLLGLIYWLTGFSGLL